MHRCNPLREHISAILLRLRRALHRRELSKQALVTRPEMLILDEVTSALDPETEAEIIRNVLSLAERLAVIAITHREAWVQAADHVYIIAGGRAEEVTPRRSLQLVAGPRNGLIPLDPRRRGAHRERAGA